MNNFIIKLNIIGGEEGIVLSFIFQQLNSVYSWPLIRAVVTGNGVG